MGANKQHAHPLLDQLDPGQLEAVVHLLEVMTGPLSRALAAAPAEEEEITPETAAALERARASLARGEGVTTSVASRVSTSERRNRAGTNRGSVVAGSPRRFACKLIASTSGAFLSIESFSDEGEQLVVLEESKTKGASGRWLLVCDPYIWRTSASPWKTLISS